MSDTVTSRLSGFHKLPIDERLATVGRMFRLSDAELEQLRGSGALDPLLANQMIENAVGTFSLPLGLGLNLKVNGRDYLVPMAVEEPSVVAAASFAAKIVREAGGFTAEADEPLMIGQVQVTRYGDPTEATAEDSRGPRADSRAGQQLPPGHGAPRRRAQDVEVRVLPARGPARRAAARRPPRHRHARGDGRQPDQHRGRGRGAAD